MTTPADLISLALVDSGVLGVGQIALAQDVNNTFTRLNQMLAQWQRKRWLIWHLIDLSVPSTGAQSYSIGPGGDIPMLVRPDRIESAFFRQIINSTMARAPSNSLASSQNCHQNCHCGECTGRLRPALGR